MIVEFFVGLIIGIIWIFRRKLRKAMQEIEDIKEEYRNYRKEKEEPDAELVRRKYTRSRDI